jgi:hypothetical protein
MLTSTISSAICWPAPQAIVVKESLRGTNVGIFKKEVDATLSYGYQQVADFTVPPGFTVERKESFKTTTNVKLTIQLNVTQKNGIKGLTTEVLNLGAEKSTTSDKGTDITIKPRVFADREQYVVIFQRVAFVQVKGEKEILKGYVPDSELPVTFYKMLKDPQPPLESPKKNP